MSQPAEQNNAGNSAATPGPPPATTSRSEHNMRSMLCEMSKKAEGSAYREVLKLILEQNPGLYDLAKRKWEETADATMAAEIGRRTRYAGLMEFYENRYRPKTGNLKFDIDRPQPAVAQPAQLPHQQLNNSPNPAAALTPQPPTFAPAIGPGEAQASILSHRFQNYGNNFPPQVPGVAAIRPTAEPESSAEFLPIQQHQRQYQQVQHQWQTPYDVPRHGSGGLQGQQYQYARDSPQSQYPGVPGDGMQAFAHLYQPQQQRFDGNNRVAVEMPAQPRQYSIDENGQLNAEGLQDARRTSIQVDLGMLDPRLEGLSPSPSTDAGEEKQL
ncbi:hypothetical protein BX600DRAFT_440506 [Xylariales sp. PMI_506]|nr:hypothetical protein BX600DRAFT_440506 [Xylariales sp. PMI_506]